METSLLQNNGIEALPQFLTSLAIGLLIGLERERNPSAKAGLRTFALVAVFGTLTALLSAKLGSPWLLIAGLLTVASMIVAAYIKVPAEENDPGTTTMVALVLCYMLGAMVWYDLAKLAVMLAIGITALLYFKPELRGLSQKLTRRDLVAVLQFAVLTFIVLPILPDRSFGPYNAFNPHQAWLMVVLISGISLAGYAALHVVGARYGAPLLGFFGGLASSTATTMIYARHGKGNQAMLNLAASVIVIAGMVVLLRLLVVSAAVAYGALPGLLPVLAGGLLSGLAVALYNWRKMGKAAELYVPETSNPAELHTAIGFGLLYVIVLLGSAWMADIAGSQGLYAVALASGLTDVDAITLSSLRLFNLGQLSEQQTVTAIALAVLANLAFKFGMVVFIGGRALARQVAAGFGAIACGVIAGLFAL
ncbi:MAG: magnesium transporter MgtC [Gallionellales bacterium RIFCSPLOWO2_12_FULL_59_22]|nr:MAG: magnesium transporter MgtC [Gallionellales bacterium RIFCSPLOWO2_02_FULL_59_110]OGT10458.1 MAG: magnesium transporter MgtC [Gallionellales bacterium RIFCSPLOWO2_12_FULL_59_22]